ncbi:MAG: hypothetical protein IJ757_00520 [Clostridiales bacterium]|nr:hypothetical protein [Clostridiales bacterium]
MGEYYSWINIDKKEYICPVDFDLGNKLTESSHAHNALLCALFELLDEEWKGCRVIFAGDERELIPEEENDALKLLYSLSEACGYPGCISDTILELLVNVSYKFKATKKLYKEKPIDWSPPYRDLFLRTGREYKFIVNYTKKLYFKVNGGKNPLPGLMRFGCDGIGEWVGDVIGVADEVDSSLEEIVIVDNNDRDLILKLISEPSEPNDALRKLFNT